MKKILLVDDDNATADIVSLMLSKKYNLEVAKNGIEAIRCSSNNRFSLILMDIKLGSQPNGIETSRYIRKIKYYEKIPIIAFTAYALKGDRENFISLGFTDYLSKLFSKNQLEEIIQKIF